MVEFGARVHYILEDRDKGRVTELSAKVLPGTWLGLEPTTNEARIGTASGHV